MHFNARHTVCSLRGDQTFDPVNYMYVKEVSHMKHMHADSILIHLNFFESNDHVTQFVRKPTFDPLTN